ncbi:metallophosphoesterase [Lichenihabitans sp. Uapishka_5]|uniref:metallophosphoesterase n=1 Tax=Lichenihabitans sp. Uapishka_5 TaxID=3037302 RepID=UPI0029E81AC7|nr:metallophosphoesterase [Lichenihabitans sp. Uapishka_5]MDX7953650.1 metallophosphoesterase [Lichenihabitans sp. Uapishka_5]
MTTFFTSDTHFGDMRILRIDKRPFKSLAEHDAALVANWNALVGPDDTVWHLGDFALGPPDAAVAALLDGLNGTKHLIVGNNDGPGTLQAPAWASVSHYAEITEGDTGLILCHYAFRTWNAMGRGTLNLHGHSHGLLKTAPKQYDVGVDVWAFHPVTLEQIRARRRVTRIKHFGGPAEPAEEA